MGKKWEQWQILFSWSPKSLQMVIEATKLRHLLLEERRTKWQTDLDSILKSRDFTLPTKIYILKPKLFGFFSRNVRIWELDQKEGWTLKNWCFRTVVLKNTLESPLDSREIKPVNPKGNQYWICIARTDAEVEAPILWPPDAKSWLIGKDRDAGKDWRQEVWLRHRVWYGWMAPLSQWTWVWANSRR